MLANAFVDTEPASTPQGAALTVYFDGACPVCSREIAAYQRQAGAERRIWVDASTCPESALGSGLSRADALARFHVRRADGSLVDGMRGFALLWRALPRVAWLGRLTSIWPIPTLLDGAYVVFLQMRRLWRTHAPTPSAASTLSRRRVPGERGDSQALRQNRGRA